MVKMTMIGNQTGALAKTHVRSRARFQRGRPEEFCICMITAEVRGAEMTGGEESWDSEREIRQGSAHGRQCSGPCGLGLRALHFGAPMGALATESGRGSGLWMLLSCLRGR